MILVSIDLLKHCLPSITHQSPLVSVLTFQTEASSPRSSNFCSGLALKALHLFCSSTYSLILLKVRLPVTKIPPLFFL